MKKLLFIFSLVCGLSFISPAQNNVTISIGENTCISEIALVYESATKETVSAGCTGDYVFGSEEMVSYITIKGVNCYPRVLTVIRVDGGTIKVRQIATADGPRYIVKADGVVYD